MKKKILLWLFLFIFLTTYNYQGKNNFFSGLFNIKDIEIEGVINSDKEKLRTRFDTIKNKNLFFLKEKDFDNVIKNMDFVNSLNIKKIYPQKIKIIIVEDLPIGTYFNTFGEKYLLLENKKIIKYKNYVFKDLPEVYGEGAMEKFSDFYLSLKNTELNLNLIKKFNYFEIDRWDLLLKDDKLIKLPRENYLESVIKFLEIYEKRTFKKFNVFDFRIKNELIMR